MLPSFLLLLASLPAFVGVLTVVSFSAVAFIPAVAVFPAVDGVFAVASFPVNPSVPLLLLLVYICSVLYNETYIDHLTIGLRLLDCHFYLLSNYQTIEYWTGKFGKPSNYQISDQAHNISDYRISDSQKISVAHL
jgi:hypothetical protein